MSALQNLRQKIAKVKAQHEIADDDGVQDTHQIRAQMISKNIELGDGRVLQLDMKKDLNVELEHLDDEMKKQAANFGFVSVLYEVSARHSDHLYNKLEELKAMKYFELKTGRFEQMYAGVRVTEDGIKHALVLDLEVKEAQEKYEKAKHDSNILLSYKMALLTKKDMLQSLNSAMNRDYK